MSRSTCLLNLALFECSKHKLSNNVKITTTGIQKTLSTYFNVVSWQQHSMPSNRPECCWPARPSQFSIWPLIKTCWRPLILGPGSTPIGNTVFLNKSWRGHEWSPNAISKFVQNAHDCTRKTLEQVKSNDNTGDNV